MAKVIVGLDIGTTKIACFVGQKNEHGKLDILSMGTSESLGVKRGMVQNIDQTVLSIEKAVQAAQDRVEGKLAIKSVNVGIAGQHIKSIQHRGILTRKNTENEISQKDVDELTQEMHHLAMNPGEAIISVLPQEYIVDNELGIKNPIGMPGTRLEANFHIIIGNLNATMNIHKCIERAGLKVNEIILEPIASADAVLTDEEKEAGVVLVDIGGGTTDVAIFHEGIIRHTAVIPFGGDVITNDIKDGCSIMKRYAEAIKVKFGSALASESQSNEIVCIPGLKGREPKEISLKNLASIIQARIEEIVEMVYLEIRNSGYEKKLIGGIVVTGGGSELKHIKQLFEYVTGMDTRIGYPNEHIASNSIVNNIASPIYATGIGLVLKGFDKNLDVIKSGATEEKAEAEEKEKNKKIVSEKPTRGSFFDEIKKLGQKLFPDEKID